MVLSIYPSTYLLKPFLLLKPTKEPDGSWYSEGAVHHPRMAGASYHLSVLGVQGIFLQINYDKSQTGHCS